jgi:5,10-methylenetetrahydromethanopterin reductase
MRFGIEFVPNMKYFELEYYSKFAEEKGFENVWITDHYNNRNVYSMLTLLAIKTDRMRVGAGVANPFTMHPAVIASAIGTVNEISGGRAVLGIAAGDRVTFDRIGIEWKKPLKRLKEAVEIIKLLHSGKSVKFDGEFFKTNGAKLDFKCGECPIYIGAQGPKMLQLAAVMGDGVLINASHPEDFEEAGKILRANLIADKDFDIAAYASFSIDRDGDRAKNAAKIVVAFIAAGSPDIIFERHGIEIEKVEKVKNALNAAFTKGDWKSVHESVDDELIDVFSISGTPDDIVERIAKLSKAGVTQVVAGSPIGPRKKDSIKLIGDRIIPEFRDS